MIRILIAFQAIYISWTISFMIPIINTYGILFIADKPSHPNKLNISYNAHPKKWCYGWFDLIWFDLIWFDLIWFDLIWFDLIWTCHEIVKFWSKVEINVPLHWWSIVLNRVVMKIFFTRTFHYICVHTIVPQKLYLFQRLITWTWIYY